MSVSTNADEPARPGIRFAISAAVCLAAGLAGGLLALGATRAEPAPAWFTPARHAAPAFRLRDQRGRPTSLRDARGQVVVLTFLFATCRQLCPAQAVEIRDAVTRVGGGVQVFGVSVDPEGDTPENVHAFLEHNGLDGDPMHYLVGSRRELTPVWARYGIVPVNPTPEERKAAAVGFTPPSPEESVRRARATSADGYGGVYKAAKEPGSFSQPTPKQAHDAYPAAADGRYRGWPRHGGYVDFEHTAYVLLIDKSGRQRVGFPFEQLEPKRLERDIRALRAEP
jgi:cytochrome oxidase Cu insertion factor (SCO1/SenC/PrrC family)